jgi:hypothetical protein
MAGLNGTWIYQSLHPFSGPPSPVVPWSPRGKLIVTTDAAGKVDGKLTLPLPPGAPMPELVLAISGLITPAVEGPPLPLPEGVQLTGKLKYKDGRESVNELRGYFVAGGASPVIVGTVWAVQNDPGGEPDGTNGPFVLFPAAGAG